MTATFQPVDCISISYKTRSTGAKLLYVNNRKHSSAINIILTARMYSLLLQQQKRSVELEVYDIINM